LTSAGAAYEPEGFWAETRGRFDALPLWQRRALVFGGLVVLEILAGLLISKLHDGPIVLGTATIGTILVVGALDPVQERWNALPGWQQKLVRLILVGVVVLVVLAPGQGIDPPTVFGFAIIGALYVPDWGRWRYGRFVVPGTILALVLAYPYFLTHLPNLPILQAFPPLDLAFVMAISVMMALGLNIVVGYAGLLDLGYVAFYAIGAYTTAILASPHGAVWGANWEFGGVGYLKDVGGLHISIWIVLVVAAIAAALAGVFIGLPTLRLRGDYLAIVTLGFGEIVYVAANNGDNIAGADVTGGPQGLNTIDPPGFGVWLHQHFHFLPADFLSAANSLHLYYWLGIGLVLLVVYCSITLRDSKLGRAWVAIREDETAAAAMGIPLMRTKTWAYAIGAFFGGIAGAALKAQQGSAVPGDFLFNFSIFVLCMVILGGMGSIWGVILGASLLSYLNYAGIANIGGWYNQQFNTNHDFTQYSYGIYGVLLVLVMLFRPAGLIPSARRKAEFEVGVADEPLMDVRGAPEE
jgi:branched-chain amino acid transport system permease protein